jgi:hypothetical protein
MHAKLPSFVGGGRNHPSPIGRPSYDNGLSSKGWLVSLFHTRIESIKITMNDKSFLIHLFMPNHSISSLLLL